MNCNIIEHEPGRWYYLIQNADLAGPFSSHQAAMNHLYTNNSNIGLHGMTPYHNMVRNESIDRIIAASKV